MAFTKLAHTSMASGNPATTTAIDTTTAKLIVLSCSLYNTTPIAGHISETGASPNTWTPLTEAGTGNSRNRLFYCINPNTSASHVFILTNAFYPAISAIAFTAAGTVTFDAEATKVSGSAAMTLDFDAFSLADGELCVVGLGAINTFEVNPPTLDSSFTTGTGYRTQIDAFPNNAAIDIGYLIKSGAGSVSPKWTAGNTFGGIWAGGIAGFLDGGGGGGGGTNWAPMLSRSWNRLIRVP